MGSANVSDRTWETFSVHYLEKVFSPLQFPEVRGRIIDAVTLPTVLDMGCGPTPLLLRQLLRLPRIDLYASDWSSEMLAVSASYFPSGAIRFVHGDNRCLPFADQFFNTVISVNSILPDNRRDVDRMISEVVRVLKRGGHFVALFPAFETSLMARDSWNMAIQVDIENRREYDTTGWQCFFTHEDVIQLSDRHRLTIDKLDRVIFDSDPAIDQIRKIYGANLSPHLLKQHPLFEHFLLATKPT
jgi:SAM-dependent methyltransferase